MRNVLQPALLAALLIVMAACQTSVPNPPEAQDPPNTAPTQAQGSPICGNGGGPSVITFSPAQIAVAQKPGRQLIGIKLTPGGPDALLAIVDDDPGLAFTSVDVELDIDPANVTSSKSLEFWSACRSTRRDIIQASMLGGFNVGVACLPVVAATNFRSGCTMPGKTRIFRNSPWGQGITEFWFRKPGFLGWWWNDAGLIDASFWMAFGGRSVRFVWRFD